MRQPRLIGDGPSFYHCVTQALPVLEAFNDADRSGFVANLERMSAFTGVHVIAWSITDYRIRLLIHVPDPTDISERELGRRLRDYYGKEIGDLRMKELRKLKRNGTKKEYQRELERYTERMGNLALFLKTLLQMFTQSYNPRHGSKGTIFQERFRSILVEPWLPALLSVAAYIDLDCVREGLEQRARDYRFCSIGQATRGKEFARGGYATLLKALGEKKVTWREFSTLYREYLVPPKGFTARDVNAELEKRSPRLPRAVLLHCMVRYFDYGTVLGRPEFIEGVYNNNRGIFSADRARMSYPMRFANWDGMHSMRNPVKRLVQVPEHLDT